MGDRRKKRKPWWKRSTDTVGDVAEGGLEAVGEGCLGCDIHLMIGFVLLAGIPLLLWTT